MILIYITVNNPDEACTIGRELLKSKLANCVNFFPITRIYNWQDEITEESETVLIVKTKENYYDRVVEVVKSHIDYDNFMGEFQVDRINDDFSSWLNAVVK